MAVITRDFNGDGRIDLASLNYANTVSIMLGQANATFAPPVNYPTGNSPYAFIAADLRKDNKTDLISLNMPNGVDEPGTISVLLGNGDGTFAPHVDYDVGDYPTGVVAGDFNDDGKIDLAVSNDSDNTISILYGNGDGTFQAQVVVDVGTGPTSINTGDFNGDGRLDIIASCVGSGVVSVLLNDGNGNFTLANSSSGLLGQDRSLVITGDFNGDGNVDAIISSEDQEQLYLLAGEGNGRFKSPAALSKTALGEIYSLTSADINNDGKVDLAIGADGPFGLFVMLGEDNGKFRAPLFSPAAGISSIGLADVNGDGLLDAVTPAATLSSLEISLGDGQGQFGISHTTSTPAPADSPDSTVAADFNGDGNLDLAIAETHFPTGQVSVVLGNGKGGFGSPIISPLLSEAINNQGQMLSGDFNGDGKPDLIIMDDYSTGFQVLLGNGDGSFHAPVDTDLNTAITFATGDVNSDGKTDVVVLTTVNFQTVVTIYLSNGDGTFTAGAQYTGVSGELSIADINGDGKQDLIFIGNPILVMLGNGNGTFQKAITGPILTSFSGTVIRDFNGDAIPDIVTGTYDGVAFLQGNGNGTFQNPVYSNAATGFCCEMEADDINGDGKLDLINNSDGVLAMLGNGDGTFQAPVTYEVNGQVYSGNIVAGDFNSDGIGDIGLIYEDFSTSTIDASLYLSEPTYVAFPSAVSFGPVKVGQTSAPVSVALTNVGNGNLSLASITVTGDFTQKNTCRKTLPIEANCTIQVAFRPQSTGPLAGEIIIKDNALAAPQKIRLTGTGK